MSKKTLILIAIVLLVLGIACYFLFFKAPKKPVITPAPPVIVAKPPKSTNTGPKTNPVTGAVGSGNTAIVPPAPTPPPANQSPKIGETAIAIRKTGMYNGAGLVTKYTAGGNDNAGNISNGYRAGEVVEINLGYKSAKVRNYSTRAVVVNWLSDNDEYTDFWVSLNDIKKQ